MQNLVPSFLLSASGVILQDAKLIPAKDNYPAKTQVKVIHSTGDFYLSSETLDLSTLPVLVPVNIEAGCTRTGGAKGFFVFSVVQLTCNPVVPGKK